MKDQKDSTETKLCYFTSLKRPLVLYGDFTNGLPSGEWKFGIVDGMLLSSQWNIYRNGTTKSEFSLPFQINETYVNKYVRRELREQELYQRWGQAPRIRRTGNYANRL